MENEDFIPKRQEFIFRRKYFDTFKHFNAHIRAEIFTMITNYALDGTEPKNDATHVALHVFEQLRGQINHDRNKSSDKFDDVINDANKFA